MESFEEWFQELCRVADQSGLMPVNRDDPESYRDYFDDGDSPSGCYAQELEYGRD